MMTSHNVLLVGASGETGGDILDGLLEDGTFSITALIRPSSADKASTHEIKNRGVECLILDLTSPLEEIVRAISRLHIIISAVSAQEQLSQLALVDAAAKAGTCRRFVPCGFTTVCPPSGVMLLRDNKETVYQRLWYHHLPYTIIDVGYWHQISWPRVPSGKLDYAHMGMASSVLGDDDPVNLLTDKRDIGRFVARIVRDPRTLNQKVFTHSDALRQKEILGIVEEATGEKVEVGKTSSRELVEHRDAQYAAWREDPENVATQRGRWTSEYAVSKYVRGDNTPENADYLGYLDAKALYPDFRPISFKDYVDELVAGKAKRPYASTYGRR